MDKIQETSLIINHLNSYFEKEIKDYEFITHVCEYFDLIKNESLSPSDLKFLKYISNISGIPHYYDLLFSKFGHDESFDNFDLNTLSSIIYESTLHVDENIKVHKYQKEILNQFILNERNRFFLSATTSFGKTFLIYEIIKKMSYDNVALIFPTIALLSENLERVITDGRCSYLKQNFVIHTLSEGEEIGERNLLIFTPERYLSFIDKNPSFKMDFVFVDEIYKIDNEFVIDSISKENERDTAYRVALYHMMQMGRDILLVGPYIEFPDRENGSVNQSFNIFLDRNFFKVINYNKHEIVSKTIKLLTLGETKVGEELTINLKGCKTQKKKIGKVVDDIRAIGENVIVYTKGPGFAEKAVKNIIDMALAPCVELSEHLMLFIEHLKDNYNPEWIVIRALENDIGVHHGLIPKYIQKEIISLFNSGEINVLISTTTITEGVNTSAKNLVVQAHTKGNKDLKTFDAKNIAGRAGRFLYHYSGRVIILSPKFEEILNSKDDEIKHKNYDEAAQKEEIDLFITEEEFLSQKNLRDRENVKLEQELRSIPDDVLQAYKVVSYSDKITVYDRIMGLTEEQFVTLRKFMNSFTYSNFDYNGFELILEIITPIVKNDELKRLINNKVHSRSGESAILTNLLFFYLRDGFMGSVNYKINNQEKSIDTAIRDTSRFIYQILKYQLVKYLGVFNLMYKYFISLQEHKKMDSILGVDKLLVKLEYNALTEKGRRASDYGVPSKVISYYDEESKNSSKIKRGFDGYEQHAFGKVERIFKNNE